MGLQSVLVTGASRGLGLEFVRRIVSDSSAPEFVFAACRDPKKADELRALSKKHTSVKVIQMDVTNDDQIKSAFEKVYDILGDKGLNLLINNAAINVKGDDGTLLTQTRERMQTHFNTNVTAPVLVVKEFLPLLRAAAKNNSSQPMGIKRAAVVNISSGMGSVECTLKAKCDAYHYRATKAALNMLTATMSMELREDGVLVSAIHPGWVQTDMGGPKADLKKDVSIEACWSTISGMTEDSTGKLLNYDGKLMPW